MGFTLLSVIMFVVFTVLQSSFFSHFSLFGAIPNLVFIFFVLLLFHGKKFDAKQAFLAIFGGMCADFFSGVTLGTSSLIFLIIAFVVSKISESTLEKKWEKNIVFFLLFFSILNVVYLALFDIFFAWQEKNILMINFGKEFVFTIIYNLILSIAGFYLYKNVQKLQNKK